jgi:hypothetical protein
MSGRASVGPSWVVSFVLVLTRTRAPRINAREKSHCKETTITSDNASARICQKIEQREINSRESHASTYLLRSERNLKYMEYCDFGRFRSKKCGTVWPNFWWFRRILFATIEFSAQLNNSGAEHPLASFLPCTRTATLSKRKNAGTGTG